MRRFLVGALLAVVTGCGGAPSGPTGDFMEPCHAADGSCNRLLVCAEDFRGVQSCEPLVDAASCGRPGQPCCKAYNVDEHTLSPACAGPNQCLFYCFAGFRCDESHATGDVNVCVPE